MNRVGDGSLDRAAPGGSSGLEASRLKETRPSRPLNEYAEAWKAVHRDMRCRGTVGTSGLKIRVSAVRFRPWPFKQDNELGKKGAVGRAAPVRENVREPRATGRAFLYWYSQLPWLSG
jgi:hypothetical protein